MRLFYFVSKLKALFFILLTFSYLPQDASAQMRQVFLDNGQANNEIYKISFYSPSNGYVAFRDWIGYTSDSGKTFTRKYITNSNVDYNGYGVNITFGFEINGVKAFNQNTIIAYGGYGLVPAILYSTNGGDNFKLIYHSQYNPLQLSGGITDMIFPQNGSIGYAVDADRILKTINQGISWSVVRVDPASFFTSLEAVDDNTIFAFNASTKLLKSINAGGGWQPVAVPSLFSENISYVHFLTGTIGWLSMNGFERKLFYKTTDGGANWVLQNNREATPFVCSKMKFTDNNTGYALSDLFTVFKTLNSGVTWEPLPRDNNYTYLGYSHNDLQCLSANQLWAGGGHGFLELSINGGGVPLPTAYFKIDTGNVWQSNVVNLINYSRTGYQYKWYVNNNEISTNYNAFYTHQIARQVDTIALIVSNGTISDTLTRLQYFNVPNLPRITSFFPLTGSDGTLVTINGTGLTGVSSVKFGGVNASSFTVVSGEVINAIVAGGSTGTVSVTDSRGTFSQPGFTYVPPPISPPPFVSSVVPESGPIGTSVVLNGTNFSSSPGGNIVFFGATKATITSATSSQITCNVPAGANFEAVSVLNTTTNLSGVSPRPFNVTFADSSNFTTNSFAPSFELNFGSYGTTKDVAGNDIDGDGKVDLVTIITRYGDSIVVFKNVSTGDTISFEPRKNVGHAQPLGSGRFKLGDLDNDGKPEIVVTTNSKNVGVLRNISSPGVISYESQISLDCNSGGSWDVNIGDIDNDGRNDIAVALNGTGGNLAILRNTSSVGNLSFAASINLLMNTFIHSVVIGDLDGDGKKDVVVYQRAFFNGTETGTISYLRNTSSKGTISFASAASFVVPGSALIGKNLSLADMDGDRKLDIVVTNTYYQVFRNISTVGNISFAPIVCDLSLLYDYGGLICNLNGDNKPDQVGSRLSLGLLSNASVPGSIKNDPFVSVSGYNPTNLGEGDFNGDGKADLIASQSNWNKLSIIKNVMGIPIEFSVCSGGYTSLTADISATGWQWQQDSGNGFINIVDNANFSGTKSNILIFNNTPPLWNGYRYRCIGNNNLKSSVFKMKMMGIIVPGININASNTTTCYGDPVIFTASGANAGPNPRYQWQVNGVNVGTNSATFTSNILNNNDRVRVILSSVDGCAVYLKDTSNTITMVVAGVAPSVSINASSTSICSGTSITFTATPLNAGAVPAYQWKVNGVNVGTNSNSFVTSALKNGDIVKVSITNDPVCGTPVTVSSANILMNVTPMLTPLVNIYASTASSNCEGAEILIIADATTSGLNSNYQWTLNGVNVGTNTNSFSSSGFKNNDKLQVIYTLNFPCVTTSTAVSNVLTLSIAPVVTPAVTINGATTVVQGQATIISVSQVNGGTLPAYQWQDSTNSNGWKNISGSNNATISYAPIATGHRLRCLLTSNANCANPQTVASNAIVFTITTVTAINPVPANRLGIKYYPNPVSSVFTIDSLKLSDRWETVELTSIDGRHKMRLITIAGQPRISLDLSFLPAGYYLAILNRKKGAPVYLKFMKQ
jgi:hypothetical protein